MENPTFKIHYEAGSQPAYVYRNQEACEENTERPGVFHCSDVDIVLVGEAAQSQADKLAAFLTKKKDKEKQTQSLNIGQQLRLGSVVQSNWLRFQVEYVRSEQEKAEDCKKDPEVCDGPQ